MIERPEQGIAALLFSACRVTAWLLGLGIALLHVVPPTYRPMTPAGHDLEHVGIFLLLGLAFAFGYSHRLRTALSGLVLYCVGVEAIQIAVPGRHPRLLDLLLNAGSALVGVAVAVMLSRVWGRWKGQR